MLKKHHIQKSVYTKPQNCFLVQAGFGTAFTYLTSGVFLSGLALLMGAGDVLVSYLSVIVNICGVLILVFAGFLEQFESRKWLTIVLTTISKLAVLFIAAIPALVPAKLQLILLIPTVVIAFTLQAQATVVLNQWMMGFVDAKRSGRYISLRQTITLIVTVTLSATGGYWMDQVQVKYLGFAAIFGAAGLMGICELVLLIRTPDSPAYYPASHGCRFRDIVSLPLKNREFTGFVIYILTFYFLLNISDSFTMLYLMKYLALPYQTVTGLYLIISLPQIILLGIWGKISDRCGHDFVLKSSIWLFALETLFMAFAGPQTWYLFIPAAFLAASVGNAGFVTAVFNRRYELMPLDNRIVYDNFYTAGIGIGFILGPVTGGILKGWLESSDVLAKTMDFAGIRLLYPISSAGILILQFIYAHRFRSRHIGCNNSSHR